MFRKIRFRFILIAALAISCILIAFIGVLNSVSIVRNNNEINTVLSILSSHKGEFPGTAQVIKEDSNRDINIADINQYQYYSYRLNKDEEVSTVNLKHINNVSQNDLEKMLDKVRLSSKRSIFRYDGHVYSYQVKQNKTNGSYLVVVLDITRFTNERSDLFALSVQMSLYSLVFFILVVSLFSGFAIKPFVENYEKQKEFITNAGHELKTPLAIISANNELQELMTGETEWTKSTKDQVSRLTSLINQLVTLARLEERTDLVFEELDFSDLVQDAAEDFKALVIKDGKTFSMAIEPDLKVRGEHQSLFELVTILVDNANKYCDDEGTVTVRLSRTNSPIRKAKLEVSNTYKTGKNVDYSRFFERFYRKDESHNSQKSGYGIGLSMAQSIVSIVKGKFSVHYKGDTITFKVIL
ncbi:HAMP domain-containing sensor histidine kinase [Streptococcus ferus]|uniref:sensor histidine kinase n=1 Tax=Streptococcus ferus TaxID=1345 RepID=UPI0035174AFE